MWLVSSVRAGLNLVSSAPPLWPIATSDQGAGRPLRQPESLFLGGFGCPALTPQSLRGPSLITASVKDGGAAPEALPVLSS